MHEIDAGSYKLTHIVIDEETINKLASNMRTIEQAERMHYEEQMADGREHGFSVANGVPRGPAAVDRVGD